MLQHARILKQQSVYEMYKITDVKVLTIISLRQVYLNYASELESALPHSKNYFTLYGGINL